MRASSDQAYGRETRSLSVVEGSKTAPATQPCLICGRGPTALISVARNLGMLVTRRYWNYSAPLCRDHGTQLARNWLLATSLMGWWGIISFFVNFGAVGADLNALRVARRLPPPGPVVVSLEAESASSIPAKRLIELESYSVSSIAGSDRLNHCCMK